MALATPIRITGAHLVCARCRAVMANVTINVLPMDCPLCQHPLIDEGPPWIDGDFEVVANADDEVTGEQMDAAYEVGR
jgi:hypothetical protein